MDRAIGYGVLGFFCAVLIIVIVAIVNNDIGYDSGYRQGYCAALGAVPQDDNCVVTDTRTLEPIGEADHG